jgi:large subunit ribosomal protein L11
MGQKTVEALIDGGKATPAPPLGPSLSVFKVNIGKIIQDINDKTKIYEGMKVPVKIIVDEQTKDYKIEIGTPPVSSLIRKELGLKIIGEEKKEETPAAVPAEEPKVKGKEEKTEPTKEEAVTKEGEVAAETPAEEKVEVKKVRVIVGDMTIDQCIKIMKMKRDKLLAKDTRKALKEIVGSVVSMPLTVEGKNPKEVIKEIDEGKYDDKLK